MHGKSLTRPGQFEIDTVDNLYSLGKSELKLLPPKSRTFALKNSFRYSGAVLWNNLPFQLRSTHSLALFRRLLDYHCANSCVYVGAVNLRLLKRDFARHTFK